MRLYRFQTVYMLVMGTVFINLITLGLCMFWVNRFLIKSYDPTVYILLAMFFVMIVCFDVSLFRMQAYQRCFYKFRMDTTGIECYDCFGVHINIKWDEIRTCGVIGYDYLFKRHTFVYFSKIPNEAHTAKQKTTINKQRFILEASEKNVEYLNCKLPTEFQKRIIPALEKQTDAIYKR